MEDRRTKPPLLYIDQNQNSIPEVESQSAFYSAHQKNSKEKEVKAAKRSSRSRFQSLPTQDKLEYIMNLQETLPVLKCRFLTKEGSLTGTVEKANAEKVHLIVRETPRRRIINVEDLLDIQIIGF